ncbi:hypothetical protein AC579_6570 [Pseudocercospora musae]|uniref:Uncharacterized protein n=1 Tax=Pseudocercospora musae TaxID=113226 RepID=A0A139I230_9PEZI|nr:hypothetical protein AC579_6570 [Pseudocercospora musae]
MGAQVNVKGPFNLIHALLPDRRPQATLIGVSAGSIQVGPMCTNRSSHNSGKFARMKMFESVTAEVPDVHVAKKAEIEGSLLLTANCIGWPNTP